MTKTSATLDREVTSATLDREVTESLKPGLPAVLDQFRAAGFTVRDTGAVRFGKEGRRVVFVHVRPRNGQVVLSTQHNWGTNRSVFKNAERATAALRRDDEADKRNP